MARVILILIAFLLFGCGAFKPYKSVQTGPRAKVTIKKNLSSSYFDVIVFEPDAQCDFNFMGRVTLEDEEYSRTVYMPANRAYFRVSAKQPGFNLSSFYDVSFLLKANQEYSIEFEWIKTKASWTGIKGVHAFKYLQHLSGENSKKIEGDNFSICERVHNIPDA